jgi:hypothetical protein
MNHQQLEDHGLDALETLSFVCGDFQDLADLLGRNHSGANPKDPERCESVVRRGFFWRRLRPLVCDVP